ncbi:MAG: hypothetical protein JNL11_05435 [Bdellovibrionaceae bacterium]|nr:hypothetical protein [Pseudobdellovibrionaceae bacterium]
MTLDPSILKEFIQESKSLISQSLEILEEVESDPHKLKRLEEYGNNVDRIMGGSKSLAMMVDETHSLHFVGDYCALCKAVGYKSSQILGSPDFVMICVALLLDATESLQDMVNKLESGKNIERTQLSHTFLDRLQWVSGQFGKNIRDTVGEKSIEDSKQKPNEIEDLMKKLGLM